MPLDGLRAWIGEVERKLGMRTRVFLVLATIAIGGAGAAIYLSLDTCDDAVSEGDVQALQERLEERVATGGATGTAAGTAQLEAELNALQAEVEQLRSQTRGGKDDGAAGPGGIGTGADGDADGTGDLDSSGAADGTGTAATPDEAGDGAAAADGGGANSKLRDLLEQAKEQSEAAENEQAP